MQVKDGLVLPDKASLCLTAIEDADYKEDKIECKFSSSFMLYTTWILICYGIFCFLCTLNVFSSGIKFFPFFTFVNFGLCVLLQFGIVCMVLT